MPLFNERPGQLDNGDINGDIGDVSTETQNTVELEPSSSPVDPIGTDSLTYVPTEPSKFGEHSVDDADNDDPEENPMIPNASENFVPSGGHYQLRPSTNFNHSFAPSTNIVEDLNQPKFPTTLKSS